MQREFASSCCVVPFGKTNLTSSIIRRYGSASDSLSSHQKHRGSPRVVMI